MCDETATEIGSVSVAVGTLRGMGGPFLGSEAVAAGRVTRHRLRTKYEPVHPGVYELKSAERTAVSRAVGAWLWSGRCGVVAGRSAAALLGAKWVDNDAPAQLIHRNRRAPKGIEVWSDCPADDEVQTIRGIRVTTPARTALDLACRLPIEDAVAAIDALARATRLDPARVIQLADRYPGRRNIRRARRALDLVDPGAQSPQETRLRLVYIKAGFPRPETQLEVRGKWGELVAVLDMGWREVLIGADYDGEHHRLTRRQLDDDIKRYDGVMEVGWIDMRTTVEDTDATVIERARLAFEKRGRSLDVWPDRIALDP